MGRFASPDRKMISELRLLNPQGWNAYSYALNDPINYVDPNGLEAVWLATYWLTVWLPTGRAFSAFDILASFAPTPTGGRPGASTNTKLPRQAAPTTYDKTDHLRIDASGSETWGNMCPIGCAGEYKSVTGQYTLVAHFAGILQAGEDDKYADPYHVTFTREPGAHGWGGQTKWFGMSGPDWPEYEVTRVNEKGISQLSDAKLISLKHALGNEISKNSFDMAAYEAELAVWREEAKREKQQQ